MSVLTILILGRVNFATVFLTCLLVVARMVKVTVSMVAIWPFCSGLLQRKILDDLGTGGSMIGTYNESII